jgi:hypothetical protein
MLTQLDWWCEYAASARPENHKRPAKHRDLFQGNGRLSDILLHKVEQNHQNCAVGGGQFSIVISM